jgi:uncharacterized protein (DUF1499 family)
MELSRWQYFGLLIVCSLIGGCVSATTDQGERGAKVEPRLFEAPIDEVYEATRSAMESLKWKITSEDQSTFSIHASVPMSMLTWGDKLTVTLTLEKDDRVRVDVQSKSGLQIVDYGKNKKNILALYEAIEAELE